MAFIPNNKYELGTRHRLIKEASNYYGTFTVGHEFKVIPAISLLDFLYVGLEDIEGNHISIPLEEANEYLEVIK